MLGRGTDYGSELFLQTTARTDTKIDQLGMNIETLTTTCKAQLMLAFTPRTSDKNQIEHSQQLPVDDDGACKRVRKRTISSGSIPVLSFSLILPYWLAQYSLHFSVCRAAQNWTLNVKPHRTVPFNTELWRVMGSGDFDKLRLLVNSGQVTVFDRDEYGMTPLHVWS